MIKKLIGLGLILIIIFMFSACESINRVMVSHENLDNLQAALPDLYYFDFNPKIESNDPEVDLVFLTTISTEPVSFESQAILTQNFSEKKYEHFGYRIVYNLKIDTETIALTIVAYKHNNRDFVVSDSRISSEYQNATERSDYIDEQTIDGIRCIIYGNTTIFFWLNEQQYTIMIQQAIGQDSFTVYDFLSIVKPAITNRYRILSIK